MITAVRGLFVSRKSVGVTASLRAPGSRLANRASRHFATRSITSGIVRSVNGGTSLSQRHQRLRLLIYSLEPIRGLINCLAAGSRNMKSSYSPSSMIRWPPCRPNRLSFSLASLSHLFEDKRQRTNDKGLWLQPLSSVFCPLSFFKTNDTQTWRYHIILRPFPASRKAARGNVASVEMLPVPMLPISNWVLELGIGNIPTLATFTSSRRDGGSPYGEPPSWRRTEKVSGRGSSCPLGSQWRIPPDRPPSLSSQPRSCIYCPTPGPRSEQTRCRTPSRSTT